jgi:hypothetical protein
MTAARSEPPIPLTVAAYPHRNLVQVHRKGDPADVLRSVPIDVAGGELLVVDDLAAWASDLEQLLRRAVWLLNLIQRGDVVESLSTDTLPVGHTITVLLRETRYHLKRDPMAALKKVRKQKPPGHSV